MCLSILLTIAIPTAPGYLNTVRKLLGHADMKIALRCAHFAPVIKQAAVAELPLAYVKAGILSQKNFDDCQHIAYA